MREVDREVQQLLVERARGVEKAMGGDCLFYFGQIFPSIEKHFREFIESLKKDNQTSKRLIILLNTPGGSAETVEKLVEIIRYHYAEVHFVVPDEAMSAGTIFCMSGDKIFMDYVSSLGPIDPQVHNGKDWVPALGYLDQVQKMLEKSADGMLSEAELVILQNQDLAMLSRYEQAKNLTVTLLKKWLVEFKFKDWMVHESNPKKKGRPVTQKEKLRRAEEIAELLSDNRTWHSHGRMIGAGTLQKIVRLKIEDYSKNQDLRASITGYNDLLTDYITKNAFDFYIHSRLRGLSSRG